MLPKAFQNMWTSNSHATELWHTILWAREPYWVLNGLMMEVEQAVKRRIWLTWQEMKILWLWKLLMCILLQSYFQKSFSSVLMVCFGRENVPLLSSKEAAKWKLFMLNVKAEIFFCPSIVSDNVSWVGCR